MSSYDRLHLSAGSNETRESTGLLADHLVELEIVRGQTRRRLRAVCVPAYLLGRAEDCDLVLADERFPEAYAYLLIRGQQVLLRHLGFAPPLYVNGQPATQAPLKDGDTLAAGPFEFRLHVRPRESADNVPAVLSGSAVPHIRPETARALAHTEALAEALDLIRTVRQEVLGETTAFRLFLGPEGHLANLPALATLPVDSAAFIGRATHQARSA